MYVGLFLGWLRVRGRRRRWACAGLGSEGFKLRGRSGFRGLELPANFSYASMSWYCAVMMDKVPTRCVASRRIPDRPLLEPLENP